MALLQMKILLLIILNNVVISCGETSCIATTNDSPGSGYHGNSAGRNCNFPFILNGKEYNQCTSDTVTGGYLNAWCATTANYNRDRKWGYCVIYTHGGTAGGAVCKFPFRHNGNMHRVCASTNDRSHPWCKTADDKWGYCDMTCSRSALSSCIATTNDSPGSGYHGNSAGRNCNFPFILNGKEYNQCTSDTVTGGYLNAWCATTANYNRDRQWGYCIIHTQCGTADGAVCKFPFLHNGNIHRVCVSTNDRSHPWCKTADDNWGYCVSTCSSSALSSCTGIATTNDSPGSHYHGNSGGRNCNFPFILNGKEYNQCTSDTVLGGYLNSWCATTDNYNRDRKWGYCVIHTHGGTAGGAVCKFPFRHNGNMHRVCASTNDRSHPWCKTADDKWGYCISTCSRSALSSCSGIATTNDSPGSHYHGNSGGRNCNFPFILNGKEYNQCTSDTVMGGYLNAWCATTDNYNRDRKWGYCIIQTFGGTAGGAACKFPFRHNGNIHRVCAATNDRSHPWCKTDDDKWGYCVSTCSRIDVATSCDPNPCVNGGTCCVVDFTAQCACPEGRHGKFCTEMEACYDKHGYPQNERGPYGVPTRFNSSTLNINTGIADVLSGIHYTLSNENNIQHLSCIGFTFGDGPTKYSTPCYGTADGQIQNITLGKQEFIIGISGEYTDQYITKLEFKTSKDKTFTLDRYIRHFNPAGQTQKRSFQASNKGAPLLFVTADYDKYIYNLKFTFLFDSQYVHELAGKLYTALQNNNISQLPAIYEKHKVMLPAIANKGCKIQQNGNSLIPLCKLKFILNQLATLSVNLKSYTNFEPRQLTQYADYDTLKLLDNSQTARGFHSLLRDIKVDIHTSVATTVNTSRNIGIYFEKVASFDKRTAEAKRRYITDQLIIVKRDTQSVTNIIDYKLKEIIKVAITGSGIDVLTKNLIFSLKMTFGIFDLFMGKLPDVTGMIDATVQLASAIKQSIRASNLMEQMNEYYVELAELHTNMHTQANSKAMLMIKEVVDKFATAGTDEQDALAEEFVTKCSDFSPPISLADIAYTMQLLNSLADEACDVAKGYNYDLVRVSNLCQTVKADIAKLKVLSEQFYNFLFDLIAALTKIVRKTIAVNMSGPLQRAENGIDLTMLTIGSLMVEMKYQTSAQARCMILEYTHGGKRPQICEHLLFTPELISDISAFSGATTYTSDKTIYAYIPTTEPDNNDPWINFLAFIDGQEQNLAFSSNISTEWLLRYGWISGGDLSNPETAYYVKYMGIASLYCREGFIIDGRWFVRAWVNPLIRGSWDNALRFEAYVPGMSCMDRRPVQITIEATTSSNVNTRLFNYEAPPTYFIQSSNMRFTYREHNHRDACPNTVEEFAVKHDNESQTSLSPRQLCAISRGDLPRIDNKQDRIYPSLLSQWTLKLSKRSDCELVKDDSDYQPLITVKLEVRSVHHTHGINECWPATRCGPSERCVDGVLSYTCDRVFINGTYNQARRVN